MRINSYKALWSELYLLRKHSEPEKITYGKMRNLLENLTKWYYIDGGGLFLSEESQKLFVGFLDEIDIQYKTEERNVMTDFPPESIGEFSSRYKDILFDV